MKALGKYPLSLRPREKALKEGISSLGDYELLALVIGRGSKGSDVLELSKSLLKDYGTLGALFSASANSLTSRKGVKTAKALSLLAIGEISSRLMSEKEWPSSFSPGDLYNRYRLEFERKDHEEMLLLLFSLDGSFIKKERVSIGNEGGLEVSAKVILSRSLSEKASYLALIHNHPSGSLTPSKNDLVSSSVIYEESQHLGLLLLDDIIFSKAGYFSFLKEGLIPRDKLPLFYRVGGGV